MREDVRTKSSNSKSINVGISAHIKVIGMMLYLHNRRPTVLDSITNLTHNLKHPVDVNNSFPDPKTFFPTHHNLREKLAFGSLTSAPGTLP